MEFVRKKISQNRHRRVFLHKQSHKTNHNQTERIPKRIQEPKKIRLEKLKKKSMINPSEKKTFNVCWNPKSVHNLKFIAVSDNTILLGKLKKKPLHVLWLLYYSFLMLFKLYFLSFWLFFIHSSSIIFPPSFHACLFDQITKA